jgi:DNA replication protein DnaC
MATKKSFLRCVGISRKPGHGQTDGDENLSLGRNLLRQESLHRTILAISVDMPRDFASPGAFIARHEDALFLGPPGTGKSHLAQAIGHAAIQQGYRVLYRETHTLLDDLAEATLDGTRKEHMEFLVTVPLLILDDLGMRKLPLTAAEELLEIIMRRYERASTMLTSNRPVEDWGKLLGDAAAVSAMLDRLLHHGHVLKCGPRSWRTKTDLPPQEATG